MISHQNLPTNEFENLNDDMVFIDKFVSFIHKM